MLLFAVAMTAAAMGDSPGPPESQVIISEFMANKGSSLTARVDGEWVRPDWIEIYNGTTQTVNLEGWYLTDSRSDLTKWRLPRMIVGSGLHEVVFASDKDQKYHPDNYPYFDGTSYHTNFELDRDGEYLALVMPDGVTVAHAYEPKYPPQCGFVSYGVCDAGGGYGYFPNPTPGARNSETCLREVVADTKFSHDRGFYDAPLSVSVTTRTQGATIRYTTDGSTPSETRGRTYDGPISISTTTTLRAMAFKPGLLPTDVDTQSYIFLADVVRQTGAGFPDTWGHKGADYEMDPLVVAPYAGTIKDDLKAVPTVSLVTDVDNWFSGSDGIYANPDWEDQYEEEAERPVSVEFFDPGETLGQFQIDAVVRIAGGSSTGGWKSDKLSMRLKFQEPHGPTKLNFPLFKEGAADRFDTLVLDARLNNSWNYGNNDTQRRRAQYTRDQFTSDIQNALGGYGHHGRPVHLYLNGLYWGLYNLHERPDESFAASYFGGSKKDYDVIKHNQGTVVNGSNAYYRRMFDIANGNLATAAQYELLKQHLDVPDFIDYMITNFYYGNTDWAHQNWYASRSLFDPHGRWRYHSWDAEKGMQGLNDNVTGKDNGSGSPTYLHQRLKANAEYRMLFADHIHRHFFNSGVLTVDGATALYRHRLDAVDRAVVGESARWGDNRIEQGGIRYTRDQHWVAQRDWLLNTYFPQRTNIVLNQLRARDLYPDITAPVFSPHGGWDSDRFFLTMIKPTGSSKIYYTTDGTDPREYLTVHPVGAEYTGPIVLTESTRVKARVLVGCGACCPCRY
ncbi:MAG: chitobiase/beta-hexosaminidase C-terminal domain-containing protein [Planctomycetota bacterium]